MTTTIPKWFTDLEERFDEWLKKVIPQSWRDWYYALSPWIRYPFNWLVIHGGVTALVTLLGALPGMVWVGDLAQAIGAWIGYVLAALFYIVKEWLAWKKGGKKWPSLDQVGDALGPVIVGRVAVALFG